MRTPARRSLPTKLRTGETRIGRWLLPLAVTAAAAFATYSACEAVASSARAVHTRGGAAALVAVSLAGRSPAAGDTGTIHVMSTSNGSPYLNWQTRIMYKTFTMARPRGPLTTLPALNARYRCNKSRPAHT